MRNAVVRHKKTGKEGHIFNFHGDAIDSKREYYARFRNGNSYSGNIYKGSELEFIRGNWQPETQEGVRRAYLNYMKRKKQGQLQIF